ncbi:Synaptojanin-1 [Thelohanellus kitauei]|uniref:phosphoinositide 5-phosphatase n=1 Tax=Thelohanellus kitauei TaxID=669202 RepID=A0A0C2MUN4_THEKT|nr:Synaptojanin-1 [Thelohanellus kitauei]
MSLLICHFVKIEEQRCIILQPQAHERYAILNDNVISVMKEHEFELREPNIIVSERFYGYLGHIVDRSNKLNHFHVFIKSAVKIGMFNDIEIYRIAELAFYLNCNPAKVFFCSEKSTTFIDSMRPLSDLGRLISNGLFYFGFDTKVSMFYNLSISFDRTRQNTFGRDFFTWNKGMLIPWRQISKNFQLWVAPIINGSIGMQSVQLSAKHVFDPNCGEYDTYRRLLKLKEGLSDENNDVFINGEVTIRVLLISRLSWAKAGARFLARGVNDEGFVGNFVETEQVIMCGKVISCFTQVRGSVPLFWSQSGMSVGSHKIDISLSKEVTKPAFYKHFQRLIKDYNDIMIVSLLNTRKDEGRLNSCFCQASKESGLNLNFTHLDYHAEFDTYVSESNWSRNTHIKAYIFKNMAHVSVLGEVDRVVCEQTGVIRTNCVDCLDRTNNFQAFLAILVLEKQLNLMGVFVTDVLGNRRFIDVVRTMWTINGNNCSKNYAGTDALEKNKLSVQSILKDTHTSIKRAIMSNFSDSRRHLAITKLCDINQPLYLFKKPYRIAGLSCLPNVIKTSSQLSHDILFELIKNIPNFTETKCLKLHVGSWNVAGGCERVLQQHIFTSKLQEWLLDSPKMSQSQSILHTPSHHFDDFDLIVVGLQEMVDLTATNILYNSDAQMNIWAQNLTELVCRDTKYVLITSIQLVGICLFVFSKETYLPYIQDVSTSVVKTGLGGTAGNKGGVAVSMTMYSSSFCFVCSHFAAGNTTNNLQQRNKDFEDIQQQLIFERDKKIYDHDYIIWLGDLNYRINEVYENVRLFINRNDFSALMSSDQLVNAMGTSQVFNGFKEGEIKFLPTYKYDFFSKSYDTSEKARIPAYTDRILWWQTDNIILKDTANVEMVYYGRTEHQASDHRPISSLFHISLRITDYMKFYKIYTDILKKSPFGQLTVEYELTIHQLTSNCLNDVVSELKKHIPNFNFYRFERNNILLTFAHIEDISKLPHKLNICGFELKLNIHQSVPLQELDRDVIEYIRKQSIASVNEPPSCSHGMRQSGLIDFSFPQITEHLLDSFDPIEKASTNSCEQEDLIDLMSFGDFSNNLFLNTHRPHSPHSWDTRSLVLEYPQYDKELNSSHQEAFLPAHSQDTNSRVSRLIQYDPFDISAHSGGADAYKSKSEERIFRNTNPFK